MLKVKIFREKVFKKLILSIKSILIQGEIFGLITFGCSDKDFYVSYVKIIWNILLNSTYSLLCVYCLYQFVVNYKFGIVKKAVSVLM